MYTQLAQAGCVSTYIEEREKTMKISKTDTIWKDWEQTCEKLKKYEKTLERIGLTTDQKLLYQADYNRKMRAAQRQQ